jgi:hypothetical protein
MSSLVAYGNGKKTRLYNVHSTFTLCQSTIKKLQTAFLKMKCSTLHLFTLEFKNCSYCRRQQNQRSMCEDLLGYSHKQAKQKTEESGLLISRILLQQVWRIYCQQTRTWNITIVRDTTSITVRLWCSKLLIKKGGSSSWRFVFCFHLIKFTKRKK